MLWSDKMRENVDARESEGALGWVVGWSEWLEWLNRTFFDSRPFVLSVLICVHSTLSLLYHPSFAVVNRPRCWYLPSKRICNCFNCFFFVNDPSSSPEKVWEGKFNDLCWLNCSLKTTFLRWRNSTGKITAAASYSGITSCLMAWWVGNGLFAYL